LTAATPGWEVRWSGAQRNLMAGDIRPTIDLGSLARRPSLCALGPREHLQGEITIIRGRPAVSRVDEGRIVVDPSFEHRAPFLAWVEVDRWRECPISAPIASLSELDELIAREARDADIDTSRPFPFLIRGRAEQVKLHILDKRDGLAHTRELHEAAKVKFVFSSLEAEAIGFYSPAHRGIFIPHDASLHLHLATVDGAVAGHVDDLRLGAGVVLSLPSVD
jgi:acetolactate decarboxylase